jgi:hypothetical protein
MFDWDVCTVSRVIKSVPKKTPSKVSSSSAVPLLPYSYSNSENLPTDLYQATIPPLLHTELESYLAPSLYMFIAGPAYTLFAYMYIARLANLYMFIAGFSLPMASKHRREAVRALCLPDLPDGCVHGACRQVPEERHLGSAA